MFVLEQKQYILVVVSIGFKTYYYYSNISTTFLGLASSNMVVSGETAVSQPSSSRLSHPKLKQEYLVLT